MLSDMEIYYLKRYLQRIACFLVVLFCLAFGVYSCDWDFSLHESYLPSSTVIYSDGIIKTSVSQQKAAKAVRRSEISGK